jgi:hypothetical protein
MADMAERESEAACALVRVESDAVMAKEPAADLEWIEVGLPEVFILPSTRGILLDAGQELIEPRRWSSRRLHRPATLAGTIARRNSITNRGVKLHVSGERLFRGARRTAENAGGADSGEEDTIVRAIPLSERSVHCACRRHGCDRHETQFMQRRSAFHRKLSIEFRSERAHLEATMEEELKKSWQQVEEGLTKAMGRLSDAIEKARAEMPDAMKSINEEYLRVQEVLDRAVDKLRK